MESALFRPTRHGTDEGWKKGDTVPRSKPTRRAPRPTSCALVGRRFPISDKMMRGNSKGIEKD